MSILTLNTQTAAPSFELREAAVESPDLHRLLAAAIVNSQFRDTLLTEPELALAGGYMGQAFSLTDHEKAVISNVRAKDLTDFAQKVNQALKTI
jgi:hypothetical protein